MLCCAELRQTARTEHWTALRFLAYRAEKCPGTTQTQYVGWAYGHHQMPQGTWERLFPTASVSIAHESLRNDPAYRLPDTNLVSFGKPPRLQRSALVDGGHVGGISESRWGMDGLAPLSVILKSGDGPAHEFSF